MYSVYSSSYIASLVSVVVLVQVALHSNVSIILMLSGLKVIQVFFTHSSLESSFVGFAEIIKRIQFKPVSAINSQLHVF